ncbi:MAG: Mov34/MPN/PAD-1 family protein [bacterium]|nr:Mov34/MPN/PAD-1 family protein [bacterium]
MDEFWLKKAKKYIQEHNAFEDVSELTTSAENITISATVSVGLPSKFIKAGITDIGVKNKEEVSFIFTDQFPLVAPNILLRNDFPRCFPHINPSEYNVSPCIYEGNISELLQQSEWMNGLLNQLVDWLEKAASNDLMNYEQGWAPMRNDHFSGYILYDPSEVLDAFREKNSLFVYRKFDYEDRNTIIIVNSLFGPEKRKNAHALFVSTTDIIATYCPNPITNLAELYKYAISVGIQDLKKIVEEIDLKNIEENKLFVILAVERPINLISSNCKFEFLNFVIHKSEHRRKKKRELKRTLPECKVGMLSHISDRSPELLKQLSGTKTKLNDKKSIALVGCGSLGSKIGIHLARNGNNPFLCIDPDIFMPHNNARHALTLTWSQNKAELLSVSINSIVNVKPRVIAEPALKADFTGSRIIIETTASLSVRNFLMSRTDLPSIVSGALYGKGRYGLLLLENKSKTTRLIDIWANLYYASLSNALLRTILFFSDTNSVQVGQSCSSQTMIVDDARISLMAATMSLKIQNVLENGLSKNGEILFIKYDDNYSLTSELVSVPEYIEVNSIDKRDWKVRLSQSAHNQMKDIMHHKGANETGGVLLGSVFLYAKTVVVTGIIPSPPDSIEKPTLFVLGTEGLEKTIKDIEKKTNGKVTYLGTWHSHPSGGTASQTDHNTYERLLFVRNYEPTVCLIVSQDEIILV